MKLSKHSLSKFLQAILFAVFLFGFNMHSISQENLGNWNTIFGME